MRKREMIKPRVAYLGPEGTFCEQAARKQFSRAALIPYPNIAGVFMAVEKREVDYGAVPVENSTEGSVYATLDRLLESNLMICGEVELKVAHNLIVKPNTSLNQIKVILSHPQALAQCRRFIENTFPDAELREVSSTAKAVELLGSVDNAAAIGTEIAAERSKMVVLKKGIEDESNNLTRFFVLGEVDARPTGRDKTSLIFSAKHIPGALYRVLEIFAVRNINLTKIESRPEKGKPWSYVFFLDFEGHRTEEKSNEALNAMKERCTYIKLLGSYPRAQ